MILSVSRRTDIPAYYSEWFYNRIKAGYAYVKNPQSEVVTKLNITPEVVDFIVFWTKNPKPMLGGLKTLKEYPYYFQFTLNPYGRDVEQALPDKEVVIDTFKCLADRIGGNRVIWRYDPILFNGKYNFRYHAENFARIAKSLSGYTEKVMVGFLETYRRTEKNIQEYQFMLPNDEVKRAIMREFAAVARHYGMQVNTCAGSMDLSEYGISRGSCIDKHFIESIIGCGLNLEKDKNQRSNCGCVESVDIGAYNSCAHGCVYCYAAYERETIRRKNSCYDPMSPLLVETYGNSDVIKDKPVSSNRNMMSSLF